MSFNSLPFLLFLPVVYLIYYLIDERARWCVLLVASLLFYAALNVPYLLAILILVAGITYGFGLWLGWATSSPVKLSLLWGGIAANVLILVVMKYLPFLSENLRSLSTLFSMNAKIHPIKAFVAIGVSYYIFQAISYLFDIYLEIEKPERHFGYFFLYLAFFPKLLQGPIERAGVLIPQLKQTYRFDYNNLRFGLLLFSWGLFKKVVIADRLGMFVNSVYNDVHSYQGLPLILATYFYAFQIFMDFSAYTDMALGSARLFNINLTQNFDSPYLATSMADFWRRWHITFSRWILDYIFKPLQMQWRNGRNWGIAAALVITFLVSGIWHGASWGFVIWGGLHGAYLAFSVFYKPYQKKLHKFLRLEKTYILKCAQVVITFNLVCFAWIFFRASSLRDAWYVISHSVIFNSGASNHLSIKEYISQNVFLKQSSREFAIALLCLGLMMFISILTHRDDKKNLSSILNCKSRFFRWSVYYALAVSILVFAVYESGAFIYYQF